MKIEINIKLSADCEIDDQIALFADVKFAIQKITQNKLFSVEVLTEVKQSNLTILETDKNGDKA